MRTDDLIKALAADGATRPTAPERALALALLAGVPLAGILFALFLGPRADIATAIATWRFDFKLMVTTLLLFSAIPVLMRLARPETSPRTALLPLAIAPALLAGGVVIELITTPAPTWTAHTIGHNWRACLTIIPLLALTPLAAVMIALRNGAPASPTLSGAVAGILAGAISATYYATLCTDDSPLFVATWYTIAILGLAVVGAIAGRTVLKW
ncbi:MAG TPA: NrsF family protein [Hyphomicrobiaceae bacterium]|nr:NrsF family protein [Hyphomicrobiaceae bacterium]